METKTLFLGALLAVPLGALACSPSKNIDIYFERNSAVVSAAQVSRLANWTAALRARYPNRQSLDVAANAEAGEIDAANLALARARNVEHIILDDLRFVVPRFNAAAKPHVYRAGSLGSEDVKRVELDFLPACPHECPCETESPQNKVRP